MLCCWDNIYNKYVCICIMRIYVCCVIVYLRVLLMFLFILEFLLIVLCVVLILRFVGLDSVVNVIVVWFSVWGRIKFDGSLVLMGEGYVEY